MWLAEVFGGPPRYTDELGGYPRMMGKHIGLALTEAQRSRWVALIGLAADDVSLPGDPEFRSAFMAYVEWGTRIALANSQPGAEPPPVRAGAAMGLGRGAAVLAQLWLRRRRSSSFSTRSRAAPATANAIRAVTKAGKITNQMATAAIVYSSAWLRAKMEHRAQSYAERRLVVAGAGLSGPPRPRVPRQKLLTA